MSATKKKKKEPTFTIVNEMRNYSEDPFFKKKTEAAKAFLKKHPIPESFFKRDK